MAICRIPAASYSGGGPSKTYSCTQRRLPAPFARTRPEGRFRFVDAGLEFVVRYPVEIRRASQIDDQITRRLLEAVNQEPRLTLVPTATPRIQPAA